MERLGDLLKREGASNIRSLLALEGCPDCLGAGKVFSGEVAHFCECDVGRALKREAWLASSGIPRARGWQLKADGQGLLDARGNRIAGDTEASFFEALELH